jgi:hypothetical protein
MTSKTTTTTETVAARTLTGEFIIVEVGARTAARARAGIKSALQSIARIAARQMGLKGQPSTVTDNRVVIARADRRLGGQHIVETLVIWA